MKIKMETKTFESKMIGEDLFLLTEDFEVIIDDVTYYIFEGFTFNYISSPRILWSIIPKVDYDTAAAGLIHDYIYSNHSLTSGSEEFNRIFTRKEADQLFYELLRYCGCSKIKAYIMYLAVRLFAKKSWYTHKISKAVKGFKYSIGV